MNYKKKTVNNKKIAEQALEEAKDKHNRSSWSENGRVSISKMGLNPEVFSTRLENIFLDLD